MLAEPPVNRFAPRFLGSMRRAASCATRNPPKAVTASARSTSPGSSSTSGPRPRPPALLTPTAGPAERALHFGIEAPHLIHMDGVARESARPGFRAQRGESTGVARRERDFH